MSGLRVYRAVLRLLPASFRREYGDLMVDAYAEMAASRSGRGRRLALWPLLVTDLLRTFAREWRDSLMSIAPLRTAAPSAVGLAMIAGAATWFAVFIGPEWGFLDHGYRPNAILLGAVLLSIGLAGHAVSAWGRWSPLRRAGEALLLASTALLGIQSTAALHGGAMFETARTSPVGSVGVYTLPLAVALLVLAWGWTRSRHRTLASIPGVATMVLAIALLVPASTGWLAPWDFVFRYAYLLAALAIVAWHGYRHAGGPSVRLERPLLLPA